MFKRPDWRDKKAYMHLSGASLSGIAWEFLRRNTDYQKAWSGYAKHVREIASAEANVAKYAELLLTPNPTHEMFFEVDGDAELSELHDRLEGLGFFAELPDAPETRAPLDLQCGAVWGVEGMPHPEASYSSIKVKFIKSGSTVFLPSSYGLRDLEARYQGRGGLRESPWLVLQVDLSLPLSVIETSVMRVIRAQKRIRSDRGAIHEVKSRALSVTRYIEYLRILDGEAAGISISEVGGVLAPTANNDAPERSRDKRFRASLKAAHALQSTGYRTLPLLQQVAIKRKKK